MAHQYFAADLEHTELGATIALQGAEARHAATVSRARVGERLAVANGRGLRVGGVVSSVSQQLVELTVDEITHESDPTPRLWLVQALAKGDRDEMAIQAATELGVSVVLPWQAARSVSRWDAKAEKQRARWQTIVDEAAKQSLRAFTPEVRPVCSTADLAKLSEQAQLVVLEPTADHGLVDLVANGTLTTDRDVALLVGPEGGIAPEELRSLEAAGAQLARLGAHVLRTSTAGPAAIAVLSAQLGHWS